MNNVAQLVGIMWPASKKRFFSNTGGVNQQNSHGCELALTNPSNSVDDSLSNCSL